MLIEIECDDGHAQAMFIDKNTSVEDVINNLLAARGISPDDEGNGYANQLPLSISLGSLQYTPYNRKTRHAPYYMTARVTNENSTKDVHLCSNVYISTILQSFSKERTVFLVNGFIQNNHMMDRTKYGIESQVHECLNKLSDLFQTATSGQMNGMDRAINIPKVASVDDINSFTDLLRDQSPEFVHSSFLRNPRPTNKFLSGSEASVGMNEANVHGNSLVNGSKDHISSAEIAPMITQASNITPFRSKNQLMPVDSLDGKEKHEGSIDTAGTQSRASEDITPARSGKRSYSKTLDDAGSEKATRETSRRRIASKLLDESIYLTGPSLRRAKPIGSESHDANSLHGKSSSQATDLLEPSSMSSKDDVVTEKQQSVHMTLNKNACIPLSQHSTATDQTLIHIDSLLQESDDGRYDSNRKETAIPAQLGNLADPSTTTQNRSRSNTIKSQGMLTTGHDLPDQRIHSDMQSNRNKTSPDKMASEILADSGAVAIDVSQTMVSTNDSAVDSINDNADKRDVSEDANNIPESIPEMSMKETIDDDSAEDADIAKNEENGVKIELVVDNSDSSSESSESDSDDSSSDEGSDSSSSDSDSGSASDDSSSASDDEKADDESLEKVKDGASVTASQPSKESILPGTEKVPEPSTQPILTNNSETSKTDMVRDKSLAPPLIASNSKQNDASDSDDSDSDDYSDGSSSGSGSYSSSSDSDSSSESESSVASDIIPKAVLGILDKQKNGKLPSTKAANKSKPVVKQNTKPIVKIDPPAANIAASIQQKTTDVLLKTAPTALKVIDFCQLRYSYRNIHHMVPSKE